MFCSNIIICYLFFIDDNINFIIEEYKYFYMLRSEDGIFCLIIC